MSVTDGASAHQVPAPELTESKFFSYYAARDLDRKALFAPLLLIAVLPMQIDESLHSHPLPDAVCIVDPDGMPDVAPATAEEWYTAIYRFVIARSYSEPSDGSLYQQLAAQMTSWHRTSSYWLPGKLARLHKRTLPFCQSRTCWEHWDAVHGVMKRQLVSIQRRILLNRQHMQLFAAYFLSCSQWLSWIMQDVIL